VSKDSHAPDEGVYNPNSEEALLIGRPEGICVLVDCFGCIC